MTVRLTDTGSGFELTLDDKRSKFVVAELAHEKKARVHERGVGALRTEPCCTIVVRTGGRKEKRYQLFDETVVYEESTDLRWQFFAGMLLMTWLRQAQPPPTPSPFSPVP